MYVRFSWCILNANPPQRSCLSCVWEHVSTMCLCECVCVPLHMWQRRTVLCVNVWWGVCCQHQLVGPAFSDVQEEFLCERRFRHLPHFIYCGVFFGKQRRFFLFNDRQYWFNPFNVLTSSSTVYCIVSLHWGGKKSTVGIISVWFLPHDSD